MYVILEFETTDEHQIKVLPQDRREYATEDNLFLSSSTHQKSGRMKEV